MTPVRPAPSARELELLERSYAYVLEFGLSDLSLRPLAQAVGSSPRVLIFLFGSKEGLVRRLLARARQDELAWLDRLREAAGADESPDLDEVALRTWAWLAHPSHRGVLRLWFEAYARSAMDPTGPWAGFAAETVADWLRVLAGAQPAVRRGTVTGEAERTAVLAVLRGGALDLVASGDDDRVDAAVRRALDKLFAPTRRAR
jgi:AcrR family transcriptional regulator